MKTKDVVCPNCEAEFYIEHDEHDINFCPFCGDDIDTDEDLDEEVEEDEWEEDEEDY